MWKRIIFYLAGRIVLSNFNMRVVVIMPLPINQFLKSNKSLAEE